jgi:hypothetical protein
VLAKGERGAPRALTTCGIPGRCWTSGIASRARHPTARLPRPWSLLSPCSLPCPPSSAAAAACSCPRFAAAGRKQGERVSIARARAAVTASGGREDDVCRTGVREGLERVILPCLRVGGRRCRKCVDVQDVQARAARNEALLCV